MNNLRVMAAALLFGVFGLMPAQAQTANYVGDLHYQTIVNPESFPPRGPAFGDLYLKVAADGSVTGTYRRFDGSAYGEAVEVYGSRVRESLTLQLRIYPVLTVSAFATGDRLEGTASDGRTTLGFRGFAVP